MIDFATRRAQAIEAFQERGADALVSDAMADIRYFTGCPDVSGFLIVTASGDAAVIVSAHDSPQAKLQTVDCDVVVWVPGEHPGAYLAREFDRRAKRALVPTRSGSVAAALEGREFELGLAFTSHLRRVKDPDEMATIRAAARIVEAGMGAARAALRAGVREIDVAAEAEHVMRRMGSDGRIFETKVESGPRSSQPSTYASERTIEAGDLVLIDIGPAYHGYFGDLTRTFAIGDPPPARRELLELVLAAQKTSLASVRAGIAGHGVDEAARAVIRAAGRGDAFLHNTGHSLGMAGDSLPLVAPNSWDLLRAGECITVEPGAYVDGIGGVRIEDEVLVTETGGELLTSFDKTIDSLIVAA